LHYIAAAINTDEIQFSTHRNEELTFAHYPSNAPTKGTEKIKEMMSRFDVRFLCDTTNVSHDDNMKRISECDVYIELFAPLQNGKPYGSFGVTAFEAAAMGKFVITNSLFHNIYVDAYGTYGQCGLLISNTENSFIQTIEYLSQRITKEEFEHNKIFTRNCIVEKHSYPATGNYLKSIFKL